MLAEIALQIGTSCTIVIKFPVLGLAVDVEVEDEDEQLVKTPAANTTPMIFASLNWDVRLKSLLQFTSGIGAWVRRPGEFRLAPRWSSAKTHASSSDDFSQPWGFPHAGAKKPGIR
jgi:hypothetical protein